MMDTIYSPHFYKLDKIYNYDYNTQIIYKETCRDIVKSVLAGYNGKLLFIIYNKKALYLCMDKQLLVKHTQC